MEYHCVNLEGRALVIRDIEQADIEALVDYWHSATPAYLHSIGALPEKMGSRSATTEIFLRSLEYRHDQPGRATFVVEHGDKLIGYTHLNIDEELTAYAHAHIIHPGFRSRGLASLLFRAMIAAFTTCGIERLYFQISTENEHINNLLIKFGLTAEQIQLDEPDGMARPGMFNLYRIDKSTMRFLQEQP